MECLVSTDDEATHTTSRINRLAAVQEHRWSCARSSVAYRRKIAEALGLESPGIHGDRRMLNGICREATEILKDTACPMAVFDILRRMSSRSGRSRPRVHGRTEQLHRDCQGALAATPDHLLTDPRKKKPGDATSEQFARMDRELASLQAKVKLVEETYGVDNLHLTVAKGYIRRLLANARIVRWLSLQRPEYLSEFQSIAELENIDIGQAAAE